MTRTGTAVLAALAFAGIAPAEFLSFGDGDRVQVNVLEQGNAGTTFEVLVPKVEIAVKEVEGARFTELGVPGASDAWLEEGKPQIPVVHVLLARPTGAGVKVRVVAEETRELALSHVYPQQPPVPWGALPPFDCRPS